MVPFDLGVLLHSYSVGRQAYRGEICMFEERSRMRICNYMKRVMSSQCDKLMTFKRSS